MKYVTVLFGPSDSTPPFSRCYNASWVDKMARGLKKHSPGSELVVITDHSPEAFEEPVEVVPFANQDDRGWAHMMELFRPDIVEYRAILLGLDTVFVGSLEDIERQAEKEDFIVPLDPYYAPAMCNALVAASAKTAFKVWQLWESTRKAALKNPRYQFSRCFSEMLWMRDHLGFKAAWDVLCPRQIISYKLLKNPDKLPSTARVVYFHGKPKPHQLKHAWLRENWQ